MTLKMVSLGAGMALALASPAMAQTAPAAPAAATAAGHLNTADTPISDLLANPAAKAIVDAHLPGFSANPQISVVSGMTLRQIQPMAPDRVSDEALTAIDTELARLPAH